MLRAAAALCSLLVALAFAATPATAQDDDRWQLTLDGEQYVWDVRLVELKGDTLVVRQADSLVTVPVGRITEVRLIRKSEMQVGPGAAGGAMSALVGADDEVYDLTPLDFAARLRTVQQILLQHPPEARAGDR
jgi:hypothetical protein